MTTRALAMKLRRLENLTKMRPGWHDTAATFQQVVLPPLDEFRVLPLDEQKRLLSAWRPPLSGINLPPLEELKKLPVQERIRLLAELRGPPDPHFRACFHCLPLSEVVKNVSRRDVWKQSLMGEADQQPASSADEREDSSRSSCNGRGREEQSHLPPAGKGLCGVTSEERTAASDSLSMCATPC